MAKDKQWNAALQARLRASNITQVKLANMLGVNKSYISHIVSGSHYVSLAQRKRIENSIEVIEQSNKCNIDKEA